MLKRVGRSRASQERPDDTSPSSGSGMQDLLFLLQLPVSKKALPQDQPTVGILSAVKGVWLSVPVVGKYGP